MNQVIIAIFEGISAFIATNIDDLLILLIFFTQVKEEKIEKNHVISGAYLGLIILILLSLVGYFGGLIISSQWIGLLGILPIIIGVKQLFNPDNDETELQTVSSRYVQPKHDHPIINFLYQLLHPQTYKVALITFANGGDNIGVYVPLFAGSNLLSLLVIITVFLILKGLWCYLAYRLINNKKFAHLITNYCQQYVPYVLIALGLFIFWKNGTFTLINF
ncbi:cadmium resistance transporter [Geminocystis sp. GBBB08]|uniref:cadmium resistance transporter n=1 Tax=Geminocystis sp. GBBB08 TaxID=2604140 RepID=UPI0027E236BE|nr:cadmium resistance transporter [Geminocystis sp. GBBB08]MBL1208960.1 transporter [Geminocystis sp. GBBB08]